MAELAELKQMLVDQRALLDKMAAQDAEREKRVALLEAKELELEPEPKKVPARVALLEKVDVDPGAPAIGNTHDDFLGALRGFQLTN